MTVNRGIPARDGYELGAEVHEPDGSARGTVVVSAGVGFKMGFYGSFAAFLSDAGYRVVCYDYRGIGGSAPSSLGGFEASLSDWGFRDLNGVYDRVRETYPEEPLVALGHSVGCLLIGCSDHVEALDASVFVTPPHAYWGNWPVLHRSWMVAVMYGLIPLSTHLTGYFPGRTVGFGENLPRDAALEWAKWCRSPDYLFDHLDEDRLRKYEDFTAPSLSWSFTDDLYAPPGAVDAALNHYPNAPIAKREVDPGEVGVESIGHLGFFRDRFEGTLWTETEEWLDSTLPGGP